VSSAALGGAAFGASAVSAAFGAEGASVLVAGFASPPPPSDRLFSLRPDEAGPPGR